MIVLLLIFITTYFFGQDVKKKGYNARQWRVRHVCACIIAYSITFSISFAWKSTIWLAEVSGILVLIATIIYRYQFLKNLEPAKNNQ